MSSSKIAITLESGMLAEVDALVKKETAELRTPIICIWASLSLLFHRENCVDSVNSLR